MGSKNCVKIKKHKRSKPGKICVSAKRSKKRTSKKKSAPPPPPPAPASGGVRRGTRERRQTDFYRG